MSRAKAELRQRLLSARRELDASSRRACSAAIVERVAALPAFSMSRAVLTYRAIGAEVDPDGVARLASARGMPVYEAASAAGPISWSRAGEPLLDEAAIRRQVPEGAVLVLVPGVAFDEAGWRLGRGGGFYDRALAALRSTGSVCAVGLAYEMQIVAEVPHEAWDQGMDVVVTERRLLRGGIEDRR